MRSLAKLYEIERKLDVNSMEQDYTNYVRIWLRFSVLKVIYPINSARNTIKVTINDINKQNFDESKWTEIPDDNLMGNIQDCEKHWYLL